MLLFLSSDFSNALSKQDLKVLAEMDDQEVVREVQVSWELFYVFFDLLIPFNGIWNITILRCPKQQIYLRTVLCGGWCRRVALRNRELHARNDDDNEHTYICWYHSTGSETSPSYAARSSRFSSEPPSVEDDVDIWRYAIVSCTPETTTTTNTHTKNAAVFIYISLIQMYINMCKVIWPLFVFFYCKLMQIVRYWFTWSLWT